MRYWERQPRESEKAYQAFQMYRDMGQGRNLREVARTLGKSPSLIYRWSTKHDWVERVRAYDNWLEMERRAAIEKAEAEQVKKEFKRRSGIRKLNLENEEKAALQLRRILDQLEKMPLVEREVTRIEDGREVHYTIKPAFSSLDLAAARLYQIAKGAEPSKFAMTDPTGEHEAFGKSVEQIEKEFQEWLSELRQGGDGAGS